MKKFICFMLLLFMVTSASAESIGDVFPSDLYSTYIDEFEGYTFVSPVRDRVHLINCVSMSGELLRDSLPMLTCSSSISVFNQHGILNDRGVFFLNFKLYSDVFLYGATKAKFLVNGNSYEFALSSTENATDHYDDVSGVWISQYQISANSVETFLLMQDMLNTMSAMEDLQFKVRLYSDRGNMDFSVPDDTDMFNYVTLNCGMSDAIAMWKAYEDSTFNILPVLQAINASK